MKNNPLFFDSTKFRGDFIVAEIDLKGVELAGEEELFARVKKAEGESIVPMKPKGLRRWIGQTRLEYQTALDVEFFVAVEGQSLVTSPIFSVLASYVISMNWDRRPEPLPVQQEECFEEADTLSMPEEELINAPPLVENYYGVFEPMKVDRVVPKWDSRLPMVIEPKGADGHGHAMEIDVISTDEQES